MQKYVVMSGRKAVFESRHEGEAHAWAELAMQKREYPELVIKCGGRMIRRLTKWPGYAATFVEVPVVKTVNIETVAELVEYAESKGSCFFKPDTMRFFNSKVMDEVLTHKDVVYFITSERFDTSSQRKYTVRRMNLGTADIASLSGFQKFDSLVEAKEAMRLYILGLVVGKGDQA